MSDQLSRIENKLDKVTDKLSNLDNTTVKQQAILEEHIRRTELLEAGIEPIKTHVSMVQGALKLIGLLGILAAIAESIYLIMGK